MLKIVCLVMEAVKQSLKIIYKVKRSPYGIGKKQSYSSLKVI